LKRVSRVDSFKAMDDQGCSILGVLPTEIMNQIFSNLSYVELSRTLCVSKQWRSIANIQICRLVLKSKLMASIINMEPSLILSYIDSPLIVHYLLPIFDKIQRMCIYQCTKSDVIRNELRIFYGFGSTKRKDSGIILNGKHFNDINPRNGLHILFYHKRMYNRNVYYNEDKHTINISRDRFNYIETLMTIPGDLIDKRLVQQNNYLHRKLRMNYNLTSTELPYLLVNYWIVIHNIEYGYGVNFQSMITHDFSYLMSMTGLKRTQYIFKCFEHLYITLITKHKINGSITKEILRNFDRIPYYEYLMDCVHTWGLLDSLSWTHKRRHIDLLMILYVLYGIDMLVKHRYRKYTIGEHTITIPIDIDTIDLNDLRRAVHEWNRYPNPILKSLINPFCKGVLHYFHITLENIEQVVSRPDLFTYVYVKWNSDIHRILTRIHHLNIRIVILSDDNMEYIMDTDILKDMLNMSIGIKLVNVCKHMVKQSLTNMILLLKADIQPHITVRNGDDMRDLLTLVYSYDLFECNSSTGRVTDTVTLDHKIHYRHNKNNLADIQAQFTGFEYKRMFETYMSSACFRPDLTTGIAGTFGFPKFFIAILNWITFDSNQDCEFLMLLLKCNPSMIRYKCFEHVRNKIITLYFEMGTILKVIEYCQRSIPYIDLVNFLINRYLVLSEGKLNHPISDFLKIIFVIANWIRTGDHLLDMDGTINTKTRRIISSLISGKLTKQNQKIYDKYFRSGSQLRKRKRTYA
jgi:F-box associated protein